MAGFIRHLLHPGETSLESQEKWVKAIYPIGLLIPILTALVLGFWGWPGARVIGPWWFACGIFGLTIWFILVGLKLVARIPPGSTPAGQWTRIFRLEWLYRLFAFLYSILMRITGIITSSLEGEGGLLWSFLLLVLILSILSMRGSTP
jgi:hypothetical protein